MVPVHVCCRTSLQYGIACLKRVNYDRIELDRRREDSSDDVKGSSSPLCFFFSSSIDRFCNISAFSVIREKCLEREEDFHIDCKVHCERAYPPLSHFEPARVKTIKLAYGPCRPMAGAIMAVAFNQLSQYARVLVTGLLLCRTRCELFI